MSFFGVRRHVVVGLGVAAALALLALLAPAHEAGAQIVRKVPASGFGPTLSTGTPSATVAAPPAGTLPGEYAFRNAVTNEYLSASNGTLRATKTLGVNERFRLSEPSSDGVVKPKRIQVPTGGFVTASGESPPTISFTASTADDTLFSFYQGQDTYTGAYRPISRKFTTYGITQPGLAGQPADAVVLRNDNSARSYHWVLKCGEVASGRVYSWRAVGTKAITLAYLRLMRQPDGTYAIEAPSGKNPYYSARDGGGLSPGNDPVVWRATVRANETWKLVDQGDCTYALQTSKGCHLGVKVSEGASAAKTTTRISDPNAAPSIGYVAKFELLAQKL